MRDFIQEIHHIQTLRKGSQEKKQIKVHLPLVGLFWHQLLWKIEIIGAWTLDGEAKSFDSCQEMFAKYALQRWTSMVCAINVQLQRNVNRNGNALNCSNMDKQFSKSDPIRSPNKNGKMHGTKWECLRQSHQSNNLHIFSNSDKSTLNWLLLTRDVNSWKQKDFVSPKLVKCVIVTFVNLRC